MIEIKHLFSEFHKAIGVWDSLPSEIWEILWPLLLITISSYPIVICIGQLRNRFVNTIDRLLLSLFIGLGYYTLLLSLLNALFGVPINAFIFYILFGLTLSISISYIYKKKIDWKVSWERKNWLVLAGLFVIVFLCGYSRFPNTLLYPDRLLDSDPYRHYPRTEAIVLTGDISKYEPHLIGEVPIFEIQGCYALAAVISDVSGVDSWQVWKYGSLIMGILSVLSFYLFAAYFLPGRPRPSIGIFASLILAGMAVHITRTKMGFSVAWALPFLPLAYMMLLYSFRYNSILYGCIFGSMFLFAGLSNMVPVSISVVFVFFYCLYEVIKRGLAFYNKKRIDYKDTNLRPLYGLAAGTLIFLTYILIWQTTYAGASLNAISKGSSFENMSIMKGVMQKEDKKEKKRVENNVNVSSSYKFLGRNIGWHNTLILDRYIGLEKLFIGMVSVLSFIIYPFRKISYEPMEDTDDNDNFVSSRDTKVFLLILLFVPILHYCLLHNFMRPNTFEKDNIYDAASIFSKLKSDQVIQKHLVPLLPIFLRASIQSYRADEPLTQQKEENLLNGFNYIIERNLLFSESTKISSNLDFLGSTTRKLMENVQRGDDLSYINRLILEDFFPSEIEKRDLFGFIRVPTFTGRTYRYLIIPAFALSLGMALLAYICINIAAVFIYNLLRFFRIVKTKKVKDSPVQKWQRIIKACLITTVFIFISQNTLHAKGYGHWPPTSKPNEEQAYIWLSQHLPAGSKIFAYWFNADFIGSYTYHANNPVVSILTGNRNRTGIRSNMWPPIEIDKLDIPEARSISDIIQFAKESPGNYYVFKSRYGPYIEFDQDPAFNLLLRINNKRWGVVEVYELTTNKVLINKENYLINE